MSVVKNHTSRSQVSFPEEWIPDHLRGAMHGEPEGKDSRIHKILTGMEKHREDIYTYSREFLSAMSRELSICQGAFYLKKRMEGKEQLCMVAGFAFHKPSPSSMIIDLNEGLAGQVARDGKPIIFHEVPEGYMTVISGLGKSSPTSLLIYPLKAGEEVVAVTELASFEAFTEEAMELIGTLEKNVAETCNMFR